MALIALTLMFIKKLYDEGAIPLKWQFILEKAILVIAVLNYLIVFAITFIKYGIF